jgi:hypothetical protein
MSIDFVMMDIKIFLEEVTWLKGPWVGEVAFTCYLSGTLLGLLASLTERQRE